MRKYNGLVFSILALSYQSPGCPLEDFAQPRLATTRLLIPQAYIPSAVGSAAVTCSVVDYNPGPNGFQHEDLTSKLVIGLSF